MVENLIISISTGVSFGLILYYIFLCIESYFYWKRSKECEKSTKIFNENAEKNGSADRLRRAYIVKHNITDTGFLESFKKARMSDLMNLIRL